MRENREITERPQRDHKNIDKTIDNTIDGRLTNKEIKGSRIQVG